MGKRKNKKYEILLMVLFLVFFLFLASEALLFISFFWASFHSLSSPSLGICPGEGFYVPDPCELTFANTLLLTNAAVSLGGAFISLQISSSFLIFFSFFSFIFQKDFFGLILILCLYFLQTHFGISSLSHPDNPLEACALLTPLHIVPEWYFLCQYAMLKAVPNKNAGFIILLTSILALFFFG